MSNDFNILGEDLFGDPVKPIQESITNKRFVFPPFTILDAKQGEWQERKRMWIARGITGELGRTGLGDTSISAVDYFGNG
jgi:hypothetical protein